MGLIRVVPLILDSHLVAALQVGDVHVAEGLEQRLGPNLVVLDLLEFPLVFSQERCVIEIYSLFILHLLVLDIIMGGSVRLEGSLKALHNAVLRVDAVLVELSSVVVLRLFPLVPHILHCALTRRLLVIHLLHELLSSL